MCLAAETTEPLSKRIETLNSILVVLHRNDTDRVSVRLLPIVAQYRTVKVTGSRLCRVLRQLGPLAFVLANWRCCTTTSANV